MFRVVNPNLEFLIKKHEGFRSKVYLDTTGNQTIGYGRNLISDGITEAEALVLLQNDIDHVIKFLAAYSWFNKLTQNRQNALIDLCYNIGEGSFGQFIDMIKALGTNDYDKAAAEMLNSNWYKTNTNRAIEDATLMRNG